MCIAVEYLFNRNKDQKLLNPHNLKSKLVVKTPAIDSTSKSNMDKLDAWPLNKRKLLLSTEKEFPGIGTSTSLPSELGERRNTKTVPAFQIASKRDPGKLTSSFPGLPKYEEKILDPRSSINQNGVLSKKVKFDELAVAVPDKATSQPEQNEGIKTCSGSTDDTRRSDAVSFDDLR